MASTKIAFYIYYLLIISPGIHVHVYYIVFAKLLQENYSKNLLQDVPIWEHQALKPLSGAPFKWRPGHVPYLPYPRYATTLHRYTFMYMYHVWETCICEIYPSRDNAIQSQNWYFRTLVKYPMISHKWKKERNCDYDKRIILVVIFDTDTP